MRDRRRKCGRGGRGGIRKGRDGQEGGGKVCSLNFQTMVSPVSASIIY
jgi:hypothetical protein